MSEASHPSIATLRERVDAVSAGMRQALKDEPTVDFSGGNLGETYVTGAGIAAGPARFMAELLRHTAGENATFVPPSFFVAGKVVRRPKTLIVFSQGLSPNARVALRSDHGAERVVVITAVDPQGVGASPDFLREGMTAGWEVCRHAPSSEQGMLIRVLGPSLAMIEGARLVSALPTCRHIDWDLEALPDAVEAARQRAAQVVNGIDLDALKSRPAHFVVAGSGQEAARGLAWKWMEGLWTVQPQVWDVMQLVHGPLQSFWNSEVTLIALETPGDRACALVDRLSHIVQPDRHQVIRLQSEHSARLSVFEHGVQLDTLMLTLLQGSGRDLGAWPAKGVDAAIYDLEKPEMIR